MKKLGLILLFYLTVQKISICQTLFDTTQTMFGCKVVLQDSFINIPSDVPRNDIRESLNARMIDIGSVKLYVQTEGNGIPVVLLHGGPGATSHYFHPWFQEAAKFCQVIYYDQRGCGLSEYKRASGYSIQQSVEDLEGLRKALKINKWIILGHSYGGALAQYYSILHPENVLGLILVASSVPMSIDSVYGLG